MNFISSGFIYNIINMFWGLYNYDNETDKIYLEFEFNSIKIKHKINFKNIKKFINNGIYEIYEDGIDGNTFELTINKETNLIDLSIHPYITSTVEGGKLAYEKFLEFIKNDKYFEILIKLGTHFNKYCNEWNIDISYENEKSSIGKHKKPNEYLDTENYDKYAIWCIENNQVNKILSHYDNKNLTISQVYFSNLLSKAIKRGKYELVRYILEEYRKKKIINFFRFGYELSYSNTLLQLIYLREDYGLLYYMIKKGLT